MSKFVKRNYIRFSNALSYPIKKRKLYGALVILNFHQVFDTFDPAFHYKGTFTKFSDFSRLIYKINKKYGIITLQEGVNLLRQGKIKNNIIFCLTFDDGDISLKEKVVPFLTKEKIPATFFINTCYLDNNSTNWVKAFNYLKVKRHDIFERKTDFINSFLKMRNTRDPKIYNGYRVPIEKAFSTLERKPQLTLDIEFLTNMDKGLFQLGLHGHEHQRYSMMSDEQQHDDVEKNIEILNKFPNYVPYWAIPFGTNKDWNRHTIQIAFEKNLLLLFHNGIVNTSWNDIGIDRIPADGKSFYSIINKIKY